MRGGGGPAAEVDNPLHLTKLLRLDGGGGVAAPAHPPNCTRRGVVGGGGDDTFYGEVLSALGWEGGQECNMIKCTYHFGIWRSALFFLNPH